jgi:histidinol-phosphate aminotransferase
MFGGATIMLKLAESHITSLTPYLPGRPIENDPSITLWAKLGSNENCLGPSKLALKAITDNLHQSHLYPNAKRFLVVERIAEKFKEFSIKKHHVAIGNGTSELIVNLVRSLLSPEEAMLYCSPTFVMYPIAAAAHGRDRVIVPVKEDMSYDVELFIRKINDRSHHRRVKLVFLANPNNPTGKYLTHRELQDVVDNIPPEVVLVIDEAYIEYVVNEDFPNGLVHALMRPRTLVLRTFSKIYGLAGLRLGYAIGDPHIIDLLCRIRDPFNVNAMVQNAALAAIDDHNHVENSIRHNNEMKPFLTEGLKRFGFTICEGGGNFVMAKRSASMPSIHDICNDLYLHGVIIRPLHSFGLSEWVRISVGLKRENCQLFDGLEKVLYGRAKSIAVD